MAYLAACSLLPQVISATLDVQTNILVSNLTQTTPQLWKLWSLEAEPGTLDFTVDVRQSSSYIKINLQQYSSD